jgi:peptidoglycan/LPS O-acetylase OafA/YrhL
MGTYRLFLAALVALSHVGLTIGGMNPGVTAVIHFFLLSGFVMTALIRRYYLDIKEVPAFYLDRALRLQPQYLFYLAFAIVYFFVIGIDHPTFGKITFASAFLSALIIPTSFITFDFFGGLNIIAPTWSLGLEACFYLLVPFLLIHKLRLAALVCSFFVFCLAYAQVINTDLYGYRLFPGTLFMFMVGSYLHDKSNFARIIVMVVYALFCAMLFATMVFGVSLVANNAAVLIGIVTGVPIVAVLVKLRSGKIDQVLGNVSYGMFLNHFILIWIAQKLGVKVWGASEMAALLVVSFFIGWATYHFIERPVIAYRRNIRKKHSMALDAMPENKVAA